MRVQGLNSKCFVEIALNHVYNPLRTATAFDLTKCMCTNHNCRKNTEMHHVSNTKNCPTLNSGFLCACCQKSNISQVCLDFDLKNHLLDNDEFDSFSIKNPQTIVRQPTNVRFLKLISILIFFI